MKKEQAILIFILYSYTAFAQPVLTENVIPFEGTVFESFTEIEPALNEGNAGPNQIWDLSTLQTSQPGQVFEYIDPLNTPYSPQFPASNLAAATENFSGNASYSYYYADSTVYRYWGNESQDYSSFLVDAIDYLRFPFTFSDHYTDSYRGTSAADTMIGVLEFTADAYGTLILPSGTFNNCLRVLEARKDTIISNGIIVFESHDTLYHFYVPGYPESLCQVVYHHALNEGVPFDYKGINWRNESPIGISEAENRSLIQVYPNPASDYLFINKFSRAESFRIINSIGREVNVQTMVEGNRLKLDVSSLPEGLYTIDGSGYKTKLTAKFLVKR